MAEGGSVAFCLDESMGRPLADVLRRIRAPASPGIHDLRELGLSGVTDPFMMVELRRRAVEAVVTKDSAILAAAVRRDVWRDLGLSLFVLDGRWGNLRLFEQARRLIWWWPIIVEQAREGPQGGAWGVSAELRIGAIRRLFPEPVHAPENG